MDVKWFFAIIIIVCVIAIITANFFMASYVSLQSYNQYQKQSNQSSTNFNNSKLIHESMFHNITDLKKGFDPILALIPNATKAEQERQTHYNQTTQDFATIKQILQIKLKDHITLQQVNVTVNQILAILTGNVSTVPLPTNLCNNNTIPITNITDKGLNALHQC